jgi:hypothetical protein
MPEFFLPGEAASGGILGHIPWLPSDAAASRRDRNSVLPLFTLCANQAKLEMKAA